MNLPSRSFYLYLPLFIVAVNVLVSGGRLAASDELAVYLTTESLVERGELAISPDLVKNGIVGKDGRFYYGAGIAQPVLCIPLYVGAKLAIGAFDLPEATRRLAIRGALSVFNQVFAGLIAITMFAFAQRTGYSKMVSLSLTLTLIFATNLFPYFKSFMREPQLVFYLLGAFYFLYCFKLHPKPKYLVFSGILSGIGLLTRLTHLLAIAVLVVYLAMILHQLHASRSARWSYITRGILLFCAPLVVSLVLNSIYNYVQFGTVIGTPYADATFTTPLYVGLYGLLLSSGKSLFLYAPIAMLVFASIVPFSRTNKTELYFFSAIVLINLVFFSKFIAWAGDGSWGPRYLIPTLPFLILPIGSLLQSRTVARKIAVVLAAIGFIIQIGGVSIYLGNYMREIGDYPYTRRFDEPEFLYRSHFIPNYSPIVGHWRMLVRNIPINFSDERPTFEIEKPDERIPLSEEEKSNLRYTLDFWFMYLLYAGVGTGKVLVCVAAISALAAFFGFKAYRAFFGSGGPRQIWPDAAPIGS